MGRMDRSHSRIPDLEARPLMSDALGRIGVLVKRRDDLVVDRYDRELEELWDHA